MRFHNGLCLSVGASLALASLAAARDACGEVYYEINLTKKSSVPAKVAIECLRSVPFRSDLALYTAKQMRLFTQLYSAQAFFYDPPTAKLQIKPVNLNETFDHIERKAAQKDGYKSDYDFHLDLIQLYSSFRDGHVMYTPACAAHFHYQHPYPLVMVQNKDDEYPTIHTVKSDGTIGKEVTKINGQDVLEHLEHLADTLPEIGVIDRDTRFNLLLATRSFTEEMYTGLFALRNYYPGDDITITYADESSVIAKWIATPQGPVKYTDTKQFYDMICLDAKYKDVMVNGHGNGTVDAQRTPDEDFHGPHSVDERALQHSRESLTERDNHGKPIEEWEKKLGLFLIDHDTAVLKIAAFENEPIGEMVTRTHWWQFLLKIEKVIKEKSIKRLIIDVSDNEGGAVLLGLVTVHFLFPETMPYYGTDLRRSPLADLLIRGNAKTGLFNFNFQRKVDNTEFASIEEYLGPVHKFGDYFTQQSRADTDELYKSDTHKANFTRTTPLLPVNDIILLSNGFCASTCAVFAEALTSAGVKAVTTGGKPDHKYQKLMQPVGGSKGSHVLTWDNMQKEIELVVSDPDSYSFIPKRLPFNHISQMSIRNTYEPGTDIPLEFIWQPGNGHIFQTSAMWNDRTLLYQAVAKLAWDENGAPMLPEVVDGVHGPHDDNGGDNRNHLSPNGAHTGSWGYAITQQFQNFGWKFHI